MEGGQVMRESLRLETSLMPVRGEVDFEFEELEMTSVDSRSGLNKLLREEVSHSKR